MAVSPEAKPRLSVGCRLREAQGQPPMLLMPEGVLQLRGAGGEILRRLDGNKTFAELVNELHQAFPGAGESLARETAEFLERLQARQAVEIRE
ncbi:MAG: pyrroloquinoline quinone biosynthesis peptide chaperone PqqD [Candidatus Korobacteraceae bacterium]|jgi:pyrroloquinoline quinone biosynthesis protein D